MLLTGTLPCGQAALSLVGSSGRQPYRGLERLEIGTNFAIAVRRMKIYSAAAASHSSPLQQNYNLYIVHNVLCVHPPPSFPYMLLSFGPFVHLGEVAQ